MPGLVVDVTASPYFADPTGSEDSTAAIQQAIYDVGDAGGGVVLLPSGTFRVAPPAGAEQSLHIGHSGVVLRGAGPSQTFIFNDATDMRRKRIIDARPNPSKHWIWYRDTGDSRLLSADVLEPTVEIPLESSEGYGIGDWVVLRADITVEFLQEHGMDGVWSTQGNGLAFYRQITAIDAETNTITIDVPTRYPLKVRDNARIHRTSEHLVEIGIESLSIGNRENNTPGTDTNDYQVEGSGGYQMHASWAIYYSMVVHGWVRNVATYRPTGNTKNIHILSNGLRLDAARFVTVRDCDFRRSQYKGAGGNGYLFVMTGSENLFTANRAEKGRHNYGFSLMYSSGNVIHRSTSVDGKLPTDFHMLLSMANLLDNMEMDDDSIEAIHRDCCGHGHSTTQSVIWNTRGISYPSSQFFFRFIIESEQFGNGYVIGTQGDADEVKAPSSGSTSPKDWVEGEGIGATLEPASLYEEQLGLRTGIWPEPAPEPPVDEGDAGVDDGSAGEGNPGGSGASSHGGCISVGAESLPGTLLVSLLVLGSRGRRRRRKT